MSKKDLERKRPPGDKPAGDTELNAGADGGPPPTWDPGKVTQRTGHVFGVVENDEGLRRWECTCGKHGNWLKTGTTLYDGWTSHLPDSE